MLGVFCCAPLHLRMPPSHPGEYLNDEGQIIIDEEEFLLIMKLKDLRKQYRDDYSELRDLRSEVQYCQNLVDQCRNRLLTGKARRWMRNQRPCPTWGRVVVGVASGGPALWVGGFSQPPCW